MTAQGTTGTAGGGAQDRITVSRVDLSPCEWAVILAYHGMYIIPVWGITNGRCDCNEPKCTEKDWGKHPWKGRGITHATRDEKTIRSWFAENGNLNYGIVCEPSGIIAYDIDPRNGGDKTLAELIKKYGLLPPTPIDDTGGGGQHILFKAPAVPYGKKIRGKLGSGVDVKYKGYIMGPSSLHRSGKRYTCHPGASIDDMPIAEMPDWLKNLVIVDDGPANQTSSTPTPMIQNDIDAAMALIDREPTLRELYNEGVPGDRSLTDFKLACELYERGQSKETIYYILFDCPKGKAKTRRDAAVYLNTTIDRAIKRVDKSKKSGQGNEQKETKTKDVEAPKPEAEETPLTPEQEAAAVEFAKKPRLLYEVLRGIERNGVAGEQKSSLALYMIMSSRHLSDPIHAIVKAESSAGKSYVDKKVADLHPTSSIFILSRATANALYYLGENALVHKVLFIEELPGGEDAEYSLRILQSEKKLKLAIPVKDPKTGITETKTITVNGPVASISSTTRPFINAENETRVLNIFMDDSQDQTKRTLAVSGQKYDPEWQPMSEAEKALFRNYQRILKPVRVVIPFEPIIRESFPSMSIRARRDYPRLLACIEVSAYLHQYQREHLQKDSVDCVVAEPQDYHNAYEVFEEFFWLSMSEIPKDARKLIEAAKETTDEKRAAQEDRRRKGREFNGGEEGGGNGRTIFTIRDLLKHLPGNWYAERVRKNIEPLERLGLFGREDEGGQGRTGQFYLSGDEAKEVHLTSTTTLFTKPSNPSLPHFNRGVYKIHSGDFPQEPEKPNSLYSPITGNTFPYPLCGSVEVLNSKPVVEVRSINTGQTEGGAGQDQPEPESGSKKLYFGHLGEPEGVPSEPQPQPLAPTAPDGAQLSGEPSGINPNTSQDLEPVQTVEACMAIVEPSGDLPEPYAGRWVDLMARRPEDRRRPWSREAARACFDDLSGAERYLLLTGGGA